MSSHNLDNLPQNLLVTEIADIKRQLSQLRTLQPQGAAAVNLQRTDFAQTSVPVDPNGVGWWYVTLDNSEGKRVFGNLEYTLYEGSVADGNEISSGQETGPGGTIVWNNWDVYASLASYNNSDSHLSFQVLVRNKTASTKTVYLVGSIRYLVSSATVA